MATTIASLILFGMIVFSFVVSLTTVLRRATGRE